MIPTESQIAQLDFLTKAANCLNKIRTAVPDEPIGGEGCGPGGNTILKNLEASALQINDLLNNLLDSSQIFQLEPEEIEKGLDGA